MDKNQIKVILEEKLCNLVSKKRDDSNFYLTIDDYNDHLLNVKSMKNEEQKSKINYTFLKRYDFMSLNGSEKLIEPLINEEENVLYYVTNDKLFDIIHTAHFRATTTLVI